MQEQIQEQINILESELLNLNDSDFIDLRTAQIYIQELRDKIRTYKILLNAELSR